MYHGSTLLLSYYFILYYFSGVMPNRWLTVLIYIEDSGQIINMLF